MVETGVRVALPPNGSNDDVLVLVGTGVADVNEPKTSLLLDGPDKKSIISFDDFDTTLLTTTGSSNANISLTTGFGTNDDDDDDDGTLLLLLDEVALTILLVLLLEEGVLTFSTLSLGTNGVVALNNPCS